MKYIITESQESSLKKYNFLKGYINNLLSEYEWFNDLKINVTPDYKFRNRYLPLYDIMIDSSGHSLDENLEDKIHTMFDLLFPKDENGDLTAVWDILYT